MNEWVKTLVASGLVASVFGGGVSWIAATHRIDQELRRGQSEAGYDALVEANTLFWQSKAFENRADEARKNNKAELADEVMIQAQRLKDQSDALYTTARQKIASFGDESVVKAMSHYYSLYGENAATACADKEKSRADARMYLAIRNTLGVGGEVSEDDLAVLMFNCRLR